MIHEARLSLAPLAGLPVKVDAAVERWGTGLLDGQEIYSLMLNDIRLDGVIRSDVDHLWIRLGHTGSSRVKKHLGKVHTMRCTVNAVILPYRRDNDESLAYGLALASNIVLHGVKNQYLLSSRVERVHNDDHERNELRALDDLTYQRSYVAQRSLMDQLRDASPPHRHLKRALERYFHRKELVTPGEMRAARLHLEAQCY